MQDDQQNPNNPPAYTPQQTDVPVPTPAPTTTPQSPYPVPATGPMAEHSAPLPSTQFTTQQPVQDKYNTWSLAIFGLLLLTFFSPLGSVLFLPIVVVGFFGAVSQAHRATKQSSDYQQDSLPKSLAYTVLKVLVIIGAVIGLCILGIIGFFLLLLNSGGGRMGS